MRIRYEQKLKPALARLGSVAVAGAVAMTMAMAVMAGGCDMHRWAYVQIRSVPEGASVQSEGLKDTNRLRATQTPAGHFLPCTPIDQKARVLVDATHWAYVLKKADYNDEKLYVERDAVSALCAETKEDAKAKPFVLRGNMVRITSERGLQNTVKITTDPPGVSIYDAGTKELLGKSPARVTFTFFAPYKVGRVIEFRLPGYQVLRRTVLVGSINLHVHMLRPGERPRPLAPPKKRKLRPPATPPATPPAKGRPAPRREALQPRPKSPKAR